MFAQNTSSFPTSGIPDHITKENLLRNYSLDWQVTNFLRSISQASISDALF